MELSLISKDRKWPEYSSLIKQSMVYTSILWILCNPEKESSSTKYSPSTVSEKTVRCRTGYTMCHHIFFLIFLTYVYICLYFPGTHQKHSSVVASVKEIWEQVWIIFYCVCVNTFSFLFKKKHRLTWFQILAHSLIARQVTLLLWDFEFCKGKNNNNIFRTRLLWRIQ